MNIKICGQQETDIISIAEPIRTSAVLLEGSIRVLFEFDRMFRRVQVLNCGAVWMDVSLAVQNARTDPDKLIDLRVFTKNIPSMPPERRVFACGSGLTDFVVPTKALFSEA